MSPLLLKRLSDEKLGSRLAGGEAAAFDELYRRYAHRLAAYGAQLLGDASTGEDVAQAALMHAYQALRRGKCPQRLRPWLYRIAHNAAVDLLARRRELLLAEPPEGAATHQSSAGRLIEAIASLPERQRLAYVLRELHGYRIEEIAVELDLERAQVEQSLFAARNRLAELLVFGERLNCVAVQRLASGPLAADERRGLKTHLRSCPSCRGRLGRPGAAWSALPLALVDWLRGLGGGGAAASGSAVAMKAGAVACAITVAAAVPLTFEPPQTPGARVGAAAARPAHQPPKTDRVTAPRRAVARLVEAAARIPVVRARPAAPLRLRRPRPRPQRVVKAQIEPGSSPNDELAPTAPPIPPGSSNEGSRGDSGSNESDGSSSETGSRGGGGDHGDAVDRSGDNAESRSGDSGSDGVDGQDLSSDGDSSSAVSAPPTGSSDGNGELSGSGSSDGGGSLSVSSSGSASGSDGSDEGHSNDGSASDAASSGTTDQAGGPGSGD